MTGQSLLIESIEKLFIMITHVIIKKLDGVQKNETINQSTLFLISDFRFSIWEFKYQAASTKIQSLRFVICAEGMPLAEIGI